MVLSIISFILFISSLSNFTITENNGCYSFICNNWRLKEFIVKKHVNDPTIVYNPVCSCNYCVNTDICECSLLKCIIITQQNNNNDGIYQILSDYSERNDEHTKNNHWSYNDINKFAINSNHTFYTHGSDNYCYLQDQVEENGKKVYTFALYMIITASIFVFVLLNWFVAYKLDQRYKKNAHVYEKIETDIEMPKLTEEKN
jgi:hypothetical protein